MDLRVTEGNEQLQLLKDGWAMVNSRRLCKTDCHYECMVEIDYERKSHWGRCW